MKRLIFVLLFFLLLSPLQAFAQAWKLDTTHSNFFFEIQHTYATVRGQFNEFTGNIAFNPNEPGQSRFDFSIKVDSINTNVKKRDEHLLTADFFDAAKYPLITFKSTDVTHSDGDEYLVKGKLTIKDVTKNVTLLFIYHGQKENPLNPAEIVRGLDSRLVLDRLVYHVGDGKFYKMGAVGKEVNILVTLELLRDK